MILRQFLTRRPAGLVRGLRRFSSLPNSMNTFTEPLISMPEPYIGSPASVETFNPDETSTASPTMADLPHTTLTDLSSGVAEKSPAVEMVSSLVDYFVAKGLWFKPANLTATIMDTLHSSAGLSWPLSIVVFTIGIRALVFPAIVLQARTTALNAVLRPETMKLRAEVSSLRVLGDFAKSKAKQMELKEFIKSKKIELWRPLAYGLVSLPFFMATFVGIQNLIGQPVASLVDGGLLWFTDLTKPDPYYILPLLSGVSIAFLFETSNYLSGMEHSPKSKMLMRASAFITLPFAVFLPSAVVFYFLVSNILSNAIQLLWRSQVARNLFKIPTPPVPRPIANTATPTLSIIEEAKKAYQATLNESLVQRTQTTERRPRKALGRA